MNKGCENPEVFVCLHQIRSNNQYEKVIGEEAYKEKKRYFKHLYFGSMQVNRMLEKNEAC